MERHYYATCISTDKHFIYGKQYLVKQSQKDKDCYTVYERSKLNEWDDGWFKNRFTKSYNVELSVNVII